MCPTQNTATTESLQETPGVIYPPAVAGYPLHPSRGFHDQKSHASSGSPRHSGGTRARAELDLSEGGVQGFVFAEAPQEEQQ